MHATVAWDVLYFLFDYILRARLGGRESKLFTTRSPYWLNTEGGSGLNVGHAALLGALWDNHVAQVDADEEDEDAPMTRTGPQRWFAEQSGAMERAAAAHKSAMKAFKDGIPVYIPKQPTRTRNTVGISKKKKKKPDDKPYWYVAQQVSDHVKQLVRCPLLLIWDSISHTRWLT